MIRLISTLSAVLLLITALPATAANYGTITKDGKSMPIGAALAVVNRAKDALTIYLLPAPVTEKERHQIAANKAFLALANKPSPDTERWGWFPYAKLELRSKTGSFDNEADLLSFYLMANGIEKESSTVNLNGFFDEKNAVDDYRFNGQQVSLSFKGHNRFFHLAWDINGSIPIVH
jgi:hypothetical protein